MRTNKHVNNFSKDFINYILLLLLFIKELIIGIIKKFKDNLKI